jgi:NADH-quinone oxidoreductase subunit N
MLTGRFDRLQTALNNDLLVFLPELAVCVGIVALLLARLGAMTR